jgi:hypothetical protein
MAVMTSQERHQALASIYHYGRRRSATFGPLVTPRNVLSLERAVSLLVDDQSHEDDVIRSVRIGLADLCRTRAKRGPDQRVDAQIARLAQRHGGLVRGGTLAQELARMLREETSTSHDPERTYLRALLLMREASPGLAGLRDGRRKARLLEDKLYDKHADRISYSVRHVPLRPGES